jgi:hypothetical protein
MYVIIYIYIIQYCTYMYIRRKKKCATLPINSKIDTEVSHKIETSSTPRSVVIFV